MSNSGSSSSSTSSTSSSCAGSGSGSINPESTCLNPVQKFRELYWQLSEKEGLSQSDLSKENIEVLRA